MNPLDLLKMPFRFVVDVLRLADIKEDRATFRKQAVSMELQRDVLRRQLDDLKIERDALRLQADNLLAEKADLIAQIDASGKVDHEAYRKRRTEHDPYE